MNGNLLEIRDLSKRFDSFSLDKVSLAVPSGYIVGLVGANGAGKTTIIKCILGMLFPDGGSIRLFGEEVSQSASEFVGQCSFASLRSKVGFVSDVCAYPESLTVSEVGSLYSRLYARWDSDKFMQLRKRFDLLEEQRVVNLSRGMGMKLQTACALSAHPALLVLDEATAGLDPLAREEVLEILRSHVAQEDCGVLMSSHITTDLERIADRVVCIDGGRIVFDEDADKVCDYPGVAHCRTSDLETLLHANAYEPGELRLSRNSYGTDVLVPDRFQFAEAFPEIPVDRASLEEYLFLSLKGEQR